MEEKGREGNGLERAEGLEIAEGKRGVGKGKIGYRYPWAS